MNGRLRRQLLSFAALVLSCAVLTVRIRQVNHVEPIQLAPRTLHLLYLDSLRNELLSFAEQYGRPIFRYDTVMFVDGHGRVQVDRLRRALFDDRIEYVYGDDGFQLQWASDPKPRYAHGWVSFGSGMSVRDGWTPWPPSTAEYARLRRIAITPQWPEPPSQGAPRQRPAPRTRRPPGPPPGEALLAHAISLPTP